ncbi:MAG: hypothetical protein OXG11_11210 [Chloroflexi bacterium]|nr:hypothetical protein [Chloroflexota bacterium]
MNLKTGITVASVLGALVLIPVVVIVALGFYGESIGGGGSAGSRAELSVSPNRGVPDSHVRIEGRKWPPRVEVGVRLGRDGAASLERTTELPLASVLSSRNGTFTIELALPASFVSRNTKRLSIRAEAVGRDGRSLSSDPVGFTIEPYQNAVEVQIRDADTGALLEGANVRLRDSFGREVEVRSSDAFGMVQFAGIMPGDAVIEASKVDYRRARIDLSTPNSGTVETEVSLTADPGKRLLLPFSETVPDGRVRVAAIDRASGLRADRIFEEDLTTRRAFPSEISFFHLLPVADAGKTAPSGPPSVETMRDWGHRLAARLPAIVARARLLGMSANGDVVIVAEASGAGFGRGMARWFLLDSQTGRAKTRGELGEGRFVGGLSLDRNSIYVVDNIENRLEMVPVERGEAAASVDRIPARVLRISPDPASSAVYLLEAGTGRVFRADLDTSEISGPIVSVRGATWLSTDATGSRLYVVGSRSKTMTVVNDPGGSPWVATVPLPAPVGWIWVDREGPYTYAGARFGGEVLVLSSESLQIVERLQAPDLAAPGSGDS